MQRRKEEGRLFHFRKLFQFLNIFFKISALFISGHFTIILRFFLLANFFFKDLIVLKNIRLYPTKIFLLFLIYLNFLLSKKTGFSININLSNSVHFFKIFKLSFILVVIKKLQFLIFFANLIELFQLLKIFLILNFFDNLFKLSEFFLEELMKIIFYVLIFLKPECDHLLFWMFQ